MADRNQLLNDPEQALRLAFDGRLATLWTAMPGIVAGVDLATMTLSVQPAIQGQITDESGAVQYVNLPLLIHVPIIYPSSGGFALTLPVVVGDEVLIIWASRCIDAWWQSSGIQKPIEARMHDISDGFALLGVRSQPKVITAIKSDGAQLRNEAGTTYVELSANGKIKLVSPTEIDLTATSVVVTGALSVTGAITLTGAVGITGGLIVSGTVTALDYIAGILTFSTHKHTGITVGGGTSGGPTP